MTRRVSAIRQRANTHNWFQAGIRAQKSCCETHPCDTHLPILHLYFHFFKHMAILPRHTDLGKHMMCWPPLPNFVVSKFINISLGSFLSRTFTEQMFLLSPHCFFGLLSRHVFVFLWSSIGVCSFFYTRHLLSYSVFLSRIFCWLVNFSYRLGVGSEV